MVLKLINVMFGRFCEKLMPLPRKFVQKVPSGPSASMGPYGPLWAHNGPILLKELIILIKNHEIINKNIKIVNLEILKVKTWFWNKDLSSLDSIN